LAVPLFLPHVVVAKVVVVIVLLLRLRLLLLLLELETNARLVCSHMLL
jgi:hypothetical protein